MQLIYYKHFYTGMLQIRRKNSKNTQLYRYRYRYNTYFILVNYFAVALKPCASCGVREDVHINVP